MQRILEPGQITAQSSRAIPELILPQRGSGFAARAARLNALAARDSLGGYLRFAAVLSEAQAAASSAASFEVPAADTLAKAHAHGMPPLPARGLTRDGAWREMLGAIVAHVAEAAEFPPEVRAVCARVATMPAAALEAWADRLLAADGRDADPAGAPFIMAGLQAYWGGMAASIAVGDVSLIERSGTCPVCGMLPVASIVRSEAPHSGYRYLYCGLCATGWHRVRVECTQCGATRGVAYHSIDGGSPAIRAETCDACKGYRKIFYQEHDVGVEALADDLASIALDLLLTEGGFHRASANPLLWQPLD